MNDQHMKQLLALMYLVDWLANDLHYRSVGQNFYQMHLLADRVRNLGNVDALKEAYWLGFKEVFPPNDVEIVNMAIIAYEKMSRYDGNYLKALQKTFSLVIDNVEQCKMEQGLPSGIHSILDSISQDALTFKFLVSSAIASN